MDELALFAGAGGGLLGSHLLGWRTVCAVEKEPYCREVLLRRQRDGVLPLFPIWDDIRTFDGRSWRGLVDIVTAGFPCQPFTVVGKRLADKDDRNLWPETLRVLREVRPRYAFLENVPGLLGSHGYFGRVLGDLAETGFDAQWGCLSAAAIGAPHQRERIWIVANSARSGCSHFEECKGEPQTSWKRATGRAGWWDTEPSVGRVADGVAHRVDRVGALGNGQVPAVVQAAWTLMTDPGADLTQRRRRGLFLYHKQEVRKCRH